MFLEIIHLKYYFVQYVTQSQIGVSIVPRCQFSVLISSIMAAFYRSSWKYVLPAPSRPSWLHKDTFGQKRRSLMFEAKMREVSEDANSSWVCFLEYLKRMESKIDRRDRYITIE